MQQSVKIRRPTILDNEKLDLFFREVIKDTFAREGLTELIEDREEEIATKNKYLKLDLDSNGRERYFLLAEAVDGSIVGCIEYGPASELIARLTEGEYKELIEVGTIFVAPKYQRQGLGNLMLSEMIQTLHMKGFQEFCLDSGYRNAQEIWRKKFGVPTYWFKNYWGQDNDHMIWKIDISNCLKT